MSGASPANGAGGICEGPGLPDTTVFGVDTFNLATDSGDELVNIPYSYKVG